jgi:hypothetical protein
MNNKLLLEAIISSIISYYVYVYIRRLYFNKTLYHFHIDGITAALTTFIYILLTKLILNII